jgi:camelysin-like metallo-endopeptidase
MFRNALKLFVLAGLLAGFANAGSALFTSSATVDANTFTTGTVILSTNPSTALLTFSNMAPGDQVTAPLSVSNAGTLQLRYAMTSAATNTDSKALRDQLTLSIKSGVTTCTNAGFGSTGTQLYSGSLTAGALGSPTAGAQAGDRTLNASSNETLCFNVTLPINTGNTFQNATTTATFTFDAEQTANNP